MDALNVPSYRYSKLSVINLQNLFKNHFTIKRERENNTFVLSQCEETCGGWKGPVQWKLHVRGKKQQEWGGG